MSSLRIDKDLCTGCGICIEHCPLDCLRADENGKPYMEYNDCWYCSVCEHECPTKAIKIELPYLVR